MANIKNELNNIKSALYGKDVRGSIHDGIDAINKEVENTTSRQVDLENTFDQLVINAGNSNAEIVDARVKSDGTSYSKLGDRLDAVDSQLAHTAKHVETRFINMINFGLKPNDENFDNSTIINDLIESLKDKKEYIEIFIPSGTYYTKNPILVYSNIHIVGAGKTNTIIKKVQNGLSSLDVLYDYNNITKDIALDYDACVIVMPNSNNYSLSKIGFSSANKDNKSSYGLLSISSCLSKWESLQFEYFINSIRCIGHNWFMNVNDIRCRFTDIGFSLKNSNGSNEWTTSCTSWSINNFFVDYCIKGYEFYGLQYSSLNAICCDVVEELAYDFKYSYCSVNGLGCEKLSGTMINCELSNVSVNGIYTLNVYESDLPLIKVNSTNRYFTGLTVVNADIRTEDKLTRPIYDLSSDAYLKLENFRGGNLLGSGIGSGNVIYEDYRGLELTKTLKTGNLVVGDIEIKPLKAQYNELYQHNFNSVVYSNNRLTDTNTITISKNEIMKTISSLNSDNYIFHPIKISLKTSDSIINDLYMINSTSFIIDKQFNIKGSTTVTSITVDTDYINITLSNSISYPSVYFTLV